MKRLLPQTILMGLMLFLGAASAIACSCRPPSDLTFEDYVEADLIFEGTITSLVMNKEQYSKQATFKVTSNIKTDRGLTTVVISTAMDGAACGLNFQEGQSWYLWARKTKDGTYTSGICSRSVQLADGVSEKYYERYNKEKAAIATFNANRGRVKVDASNGSSEGKIKKGKRCGKWKFYDSSGNLLETCKYKRGVKAKCVKPEPVNM